MGMGMSHGISAQMPEQSREFLRVFELEAMRLGVPVIPVPVAGPDLAFGTSAAFARRLEAVCSKQTAQILLGWFFLCIGLTYSGIMNVANIAHGAGFLFGVLYGLVAFDARRRLPWAILASVATVAVLCTLIACPGHRGYKHVKWRLQRQQILEELAPALPRKDQP